MSKVCKFYRILSMPSSTKAAIIIYEPSLRAQQLASAGEILSTELIMLAK